MFIRVKKRPNTKKRAVQIVKSVRIGKKVQQKVLNTVGYGYDDEIIEKLKDIAMHVMAKMKLGSPSLFPTDQIAKSAIAARKKIKKHEEKINVNLKKNRRKRTLYCRHSRCLW